MIPAVKSFLEELQAAELFSKAGKPTLAIKCMQVFNWKDAVDRWSRKEWEDFMADRHNELASTYDRDYCDSAPAFVAEVKPQLLTIVENAIFRATVNESDRKVLVSQTQRNLLDACHEIVRSDKGSTKWFRECAEIYLAGHLPCGWDGEWQEDGPRRGQVIIL